MKKLLIISRHQFGYLIDIYKWCKYLDSDYHIYVITLGNRPRVTLDRPNFHVHYVSMRGNRTIRGIRYILVCLRYLIGNKGITIVEYFNGCSIFKKVFPWKKMILDVRTLSVSENEEIRKKEDSVLKLYTNIFDFTTIISEGTREKLNLDKSKSAIVPLGSDIISTKNKRFDKLRLLYVGTLTGRKIEKTIKGLALYINQHTITDLHYDIVGNGAGNELQNLKDSAKELGIDNHITFHGYKQHNEIEQLFDECNVGVSFVPITSHYDHQPPTKSYEYVLSGLYTIATATHCNKEIITEKNGVIIMDNEESFCSALEHIDANKHKFNSEEIRNTLKDSQWEIIVEKTLQKVLDNMTTK